MLQAFLLRMPLWKKSRNLVLPPSQSTLKYGSENRPWVRVLKKRIFFLKHSSVCRNSLIYQNSTNSLFNNPSSIITKLWYSNPTCESKNFGGRDTDRLSRTTSHYSNYFEKATPTCKSYRFEHEKSLAWVCEDNVNTYWQKWQTKLYTICPRRVVHICLF